MPEQERRLLRCFALVFPGFTSEEIRGATTDTGTWDSLATVTLAAVVEEEFGVAIDFGILPQLNSFEAFRSYLDTAGRST